MKLHIKTLIFTLLTSILFSILPVNNTDAFWFFTKNKVENNETPPPSKAKSIAQLTRSSIEYSGFFTLYQDTVNGKTFMKIEKDKINSQFIYFSHVTNAVPDAGHLTGIFRGSKVFEIQKHFDQIEFRLINTQYYYDENNPLSRSAGSNINQPVLISAKILADDKDAYLIESDAVFLTEDFQQVKRSPGPDERPGQSFAPGQLDKDKTRIIGIKNYPANTDVHVRYSYKSPYPVQRGSEAVTDPRVIDINIQHTLLAVPENNYIPRKDDPRVGFFTTQLTDLTSISATPYKDMIDRWHLEKKDPEAELSEPIEPITYWLENTTPYELRDIIKDAVLAWNIAFEEAGFKNAIQVKIQPDDADWDAGDIRFNTIRWVSSPTPRFSGYGPHFSNPLTGQILYTNIMLEFVFLTHKVRQEEIFGLYENNDDHYYCSHGHIMQQNNLFGHYYNLAQGFDDIENRELFKQSLIRLVLHEVGHTLGLTHNFKASYLHSPEQLYDSAFTYNNGVTASVMEYPALNLVPDKQPQGLYYDISPGVYDIWAIKYGYTPSLPDPEKEEERITALLDKVVEKGFLYGNDADDMRVPGKGIDPSITIWDLSNDPLTYAIDRIRLVYQTFPEIKNRMFKENESYHKLNLAYDMLTGEYSRSLVVCSRYIGGVLIDRSFAGQNPETTPFTPVSRNEQLKAMNTLAEYAFGENAFDFPEEIFNYLQKQRRGFSHRNETEDPKLHQRVLNIQSNVLNHILHPVVLQRILDSEFYGNTYTLNNMMNDLTNAIHQTDQRKSVNTYRRNLQIEHLNRLLQILEDKDKKYSHTVKAEVYAQITRIETLHKSGVSPDNSTSAHRNYILNLTKKPKK